MDWASRGGCLLRPSRRDPAWFRVPFSSPLLGGYDEPETPLIDSSVFVHSSNDKSMVISWMCIGVVNLPIDQGMLLAIAIRALPGFQPANCEVKMRPMPGV